MTGLPDHTLVVPCFDADEERFRRQVDRSAQGVKLVRLTGTHQTRIDRIER
jgi:hypothetical protein